jgi:DNA-binding CsgD family transcriptional regulator
MADKREGFRVRPFSGGKGEEAGLVTRKKDRLLDVLDAFYGAAEQQQDWVDALRGAAALFDASAATILTVEPESGDLRFFEGYNVPEEGVADYRDHVIHIDPRLRCVQENPGRDVFYDHLHHDEWAMDHDDYYAWLTRVPGFRYYAAARIVDTDEASAFFTIQRTRNEGHVDAGDLKLLRRLIPHLKRCTQMAIVLGEADFRRTSAHEALHWLTTATILLNGTGRILFANAEAELILRAGELLRQTRNGRLAATGWRTDNRLQQLIGGALRDLESPLDATPREMVIDRVGRGPVTLRVNPLLARERPIFGPDAALVVFVHDSDAAMAPSASRLRARYGLTGAETRLCRALLEGLSVSAHAERNGITVDTARSHLKRVLAKTGTDRQAGLVALLMREQPPTK